MFSHKKGEWGDIKNILMVVLGLVILLLALLYIGNILIRGGDKTNCQQWIDLKAINLMGLQHVVVSSESPCYTQSEEIKTDDEEKVFEAIAGHMYECWSTYRQGEKDFYSDEYSWSGDKLYCRVCSDLEFRKPFTLDNQKFLEYLGTTNVPKIKGGPVDEKTYLEFFTGNDKAKVDWSGNPTSIVLDPDVKEVSHLYVVFTAWAGYPRLHCCGCNTGCWCCCVWPGWSCWRNAWRGRYRFCHRSHCRNDGFSLQEG